MQHSEWFRILFHERRQWRFYAREACAKRPLYAPSGTSHLFLCSVLTVQYVENNKGSDNDWFRLESNKEGTKWFGKCWYIHNLLKYEFDVEFDVSYTFSTTNRASGIFYFYFFTERLCSNLPFFSRFQLRIRSPRRNWRCRSSTGRLPRCTGAGKFV